MLTLVLIVLTVGVSLWGFSDERRLNQLLFNAYAVWHRRQWYRMLSYGLIRTGRRAVVHRGIRQWPASVRRVLRDGSRRFDDR